MTRAAAFTLLELLIVMGVMILVIGFIAPALTGIKTAGDVTSAAYTIKGVLDQARTYAMANNTYTWVGFYEEDGSRASASPAATPGTGRVVLSVVGSRDGTTVYKTGSPGNIDPTQLIQVGKLTKLQNAHFPVLGDVTPTPSPAGATFDTRPAPDETFGANSCRFGDLQLGSSGAAPTADTQFPFQYPVGNPAPSAQYVFTKVLQFNPRGEASVTIQFQNPSYYSYTMLRAIEIGLVATHGNSAPSPNPAPGYYTGNVAALQLTGLAGDVRIYRR